MVSELRFETKKIRLADLERRAAARSPWRTDYAESAGISSDETDEIYEGYGRLKSAYPIRQRNTIQESLGRWKYISSS